LNGVLSLAREGPPKEGREMGERMGGDPSANEGAREGEDEDSVPPVGSGVRVGVGDTTPRTAELAEDADGPAPVNGELGLTRVFVEAVPGEEPWGASTETDGVRARSVTCTELAAGAPTTLTLALDAGRAATIGLTPGLMESDAYLR
jgi:hypothetical protein